MIPFKKVVLIEESLLKSQEKVMSPSQSKEEEGTAIQKKYFLGENYYRTK